MGAYASYTQIKNAMPGVISGTTYDTVLDTLATRASRMIDKLFGLENDWFANSTSGDRYYDAFNPMYCYIDPHTTVTTVAVKTSETAASFTEWTASTHYLTAAGSHEQPDYNAAVKTLLLVTPGCSKRFARGHYVVKVTGVAGLAIAAPDLIVQATCIQAARWFKRGQAAFQDVTAAAELGQLTYAQALDPDIKAMLMAYTGYRRGVM
jgi:hypothetical protein